MKKDLLIGGVDLYNWDKIKVWVESARDSGFTGDIVPLGYRLGNDVLEMSAKHGVTVYQINYDSFGKPINHGENGRDTQAHQLRFFHAWQLLQTEADNYEYVISTDVRDVVFQRNPSVFLRENVTSTHPIVISSEGILFENEPWNLQNLIYGFGPIVAESLKSKPAFNVGVLAGKSNDMRQLFLSIYNNTVGRYIPSDQSSFNVILHEGLLNSRIETNHNNNWACQCGVVLDPDKSHYIPSLLEPQPVIKDGLVYNSTGELFYIVHQWDRVPVLNRAIKQKYGI